MTVNKTSKKQKTAKTGEALTTVGIRLSAEEIKAINDQVQATGRKKADVLRTVIKSGLAMFPPGLDLVALKETTVREYMAATGGDCLGEELELMMAKEVNRAESAMRLAEHRKNIAEFVIEEVD